MSTQPDTLARGPLRVSQDNPRYFCDPSGAVVYLAGSHTWANWIEHKTDPREPDFDFPGYLDFLVAHHHNFMRFWGWEHGRWATWDGTGRFFAYPLPYARTGPGTALDGLPKFDLSRFDEAYLTRLRTRCIAAGRRGIYVAVKFFDGFSVGFKGTERTDRWKPSRNPWQGHPFHRDNNINGIDGDPDRTGEGKAVHTLRIPAITRLQEAYIRKVVDTVNDLDNVLYEICNESDGTPEAVAWQYHLIRFVRAYEAGKAKQHPIGMTVPYPWGKNADLFASPADWVSPNHTDDEPYRTDPPAADGRKVVVADTDHLWGHGGNRQWVWKSFCRGHNLLLMDPWEPLKGSDLQDNNFRDHPVWEPVRRNIGYARLLASELDLRKMVPSGICSTTYCLAAHDEACVAYQPEPSLFTVDLTGWSGTYRVRWLDPNTGRAQDAGTTSGGGNRTFAPPSGSEAVLVLTQEARNRAGNFSARQAV